MITEIKNNTLYFDGCNTKELAEKYGTPLFVYSQTDIENRINEIKQCFVNEHPKNRVAYAAKAFCSIGMLKLLEKMDMCVDVVSGGELYTAIKAEFPPEHIEFNGNNKSRQEIEMAADYGIGRIIVDSLQELDIIEEVYKEKGKVANVLYRVTPGVKSDSHDYIVTGKKDSKFGIPLDDEVVLPYTKRAIDSPYVNFLGYHFHVGSQLFDNASHIQAIDVIIGLVKKLKAKYDYNVVELNLGGGYGVKYTDEVRKPYSYFLEPMLERVYKAFEEMGVEEPAVVIEPGRSLVAEAGITLYTIGSIKDIKDVRKYVSVNGGMTDNIRPALYGAKYHGIIANKAEEKADEVVTVCGKCCESGDILIRDLKIPTPEKGDLFAIFSTGAYGYTMASNYNRNTIPGVIFVKEGKSDWAIKPQTYEDMISLDVVPDTI